MDGPIRVELRLSPEVHTYLKERAVLMGESLNSLVEYILTKEMRRANKTWLKNGEVKAEVKE